MQNILTAAYDHWFWITMTILLMIIAFCQGSMMAMKSHANDLQKHLDWLRERNDFWLELFGDVGNALAANRAEKESGE